MVAAQEVPWTIEDYIDNVLLNKPYGTTLEVLLLCHISRQLGAILAEVKQANEPQVVMELVDWHDPKLP